jgi:hypothetical protein
VYATLLLMSSTLGGDVAPAPGAAAHPGHGCIGAQGVGAPGHGCVGAAAPACCDSGGRVGLLDRIRARHAAKGDCCGPTAGAGCFGHAAHAGHAGGAGCYGPVAAPAGCCDPCDSRGHRERRFFGHHRKSSDCCPDACATGCPAPCALPAPPGGVVPPPVVTPPGGGTTPPKEMPKPKDVKPTKSKDEEVSTAAPVIPVPSPLPAIPTAPVAGNGTPY